LSLEIRAGWPCSHMVQEEPVTLGADRRSIRTRAPVAGAGSVLVLANDSQYIPAGGLHSSATLVSSSAAPYQIRRCTGTVGPDGNLFTVTTSKGTASVRLTVGERVPLAQVQRDIRLVASAWDLVVASDENGSLKLVDRQVAGTQSFIRVAGLGATSLGFLQTGARGAEVYPPWDLVARQDVYPTVRTDGVVLVPARYPQFSSPLRGNPNFKVTYTAMPERCPRCMGTYVENDYRFDTEGKLFTVQNEDLLYQACLKAILTVQGSNPYHPRYGSKMTTRIGRKIAGASASLIREDVTNALRQVQATQQSQSKYQTVRNRERLYSVDNVDVRTSADDPTLFYVDVVVRNASGQPVRISTVFTVPGTIALAGSNGQPLGVERAGLSRTQKDRLLLDG